MVSRPLGPIIRRQDAPNRATLILTAAHHRIEIVLPPTASRLLALDPLRDDRRLLADVWRDGEAAPEGALTWRIIDDGLADEAWLAATGHPLRYRAIRPGDLGASNAPWGFSTVLADGGACAMRCGLRATRALLAIGLFAPVGDQARSETLDVEKVRPHR